MNDKLPVLKGEVAMAFLANVILGAFFCGAGVYALIMTLKRWDAATPFVGLVAVIGISGGSWGLYIGFRNLRMRLARSRSHASSRSDENRG